ncbi:hypothetical protein ACMYYO_07295 [Dermacoccaceae bacterium W4C1]
MGKQLQQWLDQMALVEAAGPGPQGWGPSLERLQAGQGAFAGRVTTGPWVGHDALVTVYRPAPSLREKWLAWRKRDRGAPMKDGVHVVAFDLDMWLAGPVDSAGPGDDEPTVFFGAALEDLQEHLAPMEVEWFPPVEAARACARLSGYG